MNIDQDRAPSPSGDGHLRWPLGMFVRLRQYLRREVDVDRPDNRSKFSERALALLKRHPEGLSSKMLRELLSPHYRAIQRPSFFLAMARLVDEGTVISFSKNKLHWYKLKRDNDGTAPSMPSPRDSGSLTF